MRFHMSGRNVNAASAAFVSLAIVLALGLSPAASAEEKDVALPSVPQESPPPAESPALPTTTPADKTWTELAVYPDTINLSTNDDYQRFVCLATRADGVTLDVTREATTHVADPALARLEENVLHPAADGETRLVVSFSGMSQEIPVRVTKVGEERPIGFKPDVMPIFMRAGCNTGSCHGSSRGKDGFRLSLFGFDPDGDHFRLTRELSTRRLNLALPEESLILQKATGAVQHTGGKRFEVGSSYYETLRRWIAAGVPSDPDDTPTVTDVEIFPPAAVLEGEGASQQFIARAKYSDGTDRDVTDLAIFLSNNDSSAAVSAGGLVQAALRGEAFVMARYETCTVGSQVLVLPKDIPYDPPVEEPANYIDELVGDKLQKLRLEPSEICSDEVFLRRVTLDIAGTLPTTDEYRQFVTDSDPVKRAKRIDELLERKEFSEIWAMKWAELLMVKTVPNRVEYKPMFLYSNWLTGQIADNVPLDEMVRSILAATGGTFSTPATNFYQIEPSTQKTAENVAQVFLGIRVQCAQCHNHPFDRWTMDDYYSFTTFFAQIGRKKGEDYRETIVFNSGSGEVKHPVGGRVMAPKFLGGETPDVAGKDRREVLADWITSPDNPYFAANIANRVWAHFLGVGIVEPIDDVRISNPASNPQLLEALGHRLVETHYDFKQLVRDICNSHAYQRTTARNASNATDETNFAHGTVRRIRAEYLLDCLSQVTETKDKFRGLPVGARAVQIADGKTSTYFLSTFGRAKRDTVCACEASTDPTLSQSLNLLNGAVVENKIRQGRVVERLLDEGNSPQQVIEELTLRCFGRLPTQKEMDRLTEIIGPEMEGETPQLIAPLQDVFWALLNSREFLFNR